jgi:exopolysaccharide biosynthesis polyprenyl glycosylphosphotransferase
MPIGEASRTAAMTDHANNLGTFSTAGEDAPFVDVLADAVRRSYRPRPGSRAILEGALVLSTLLLAWVALSDSWILCFGAFVVLVDRVLTSRRPIRLDVLNDARDVLFATSVAAIATLALRVLVSNSQTVAEDTLRMWACTAVLLVPGKLALSRIELHRRRVGAAAKPTLIVGAGSVGQLTAKRLLARPELGLRPVGFLDKNPLELNGGLTLPVLGASWDLDEVVRRYGIRHVIFAYSTAPHEVLLRIVRRCHDLGVAVSLVPRLFEKVTAKISVDHVGGLPLISLYPADPKGWQIRLKYAVERVAAVVLLVLLLPLLAASALAVWLSVGRPILYRQRRVGLDGQEFEILKFRSMKDAPDQEAPSSLPPDTAPGGVGSVERRTRVGKLLRKTSIDELPQLVNVCRGEMSLVGPRPERPEFGEIFYHQVHGYGERLRVKSGITGWAQVNGLRGQTSLTERVELDNYYIENWSFWLDAKILLLTVRSVLRCEAD